MSESVTESAWLPLHEAVSALVRTLRGRGETGKGGSSAEERLAR
jgi:hypothetical protein